MGLTEFYNVNSEIREKLLLFPDLFSIERSSDKVSLTIDNETYILQSKPQFIDILRNYVLKSWKITGDILSLYYEQSKSNRMPVMDVLCNPIGIS